MNYLGRQDMERKGGTYGRGHLQSVLPNSDGIRNSLHALDASARARALVRLQKVQRVAAWCAENVPCTFIEAPERSRRSRHRDPFKSGGRTGAFRISAD